MLLIIVSSVPLSRAYRSENWFKTLVFLAVGVVLAGYGARVTGASLVFMGIALAFASVYASLSGGVSSGARTLAAVVSVIATFAAIQTSALIETLAGVFVLASVFKFLSDVALAKLRYGLFLAVFVATMIVLCISFPLAVASGPDWKDVGALLLFIVLLTLINAPFDWASLGLTRALLRRGQECGGWFPYAFALLDAALAAFIIALLAVAMVIGVQAFETVAVHSGGKPILPLREFFDGLVVRPSDPEHWWLYALLISSMIPSFANLAIGGIAFVRGVPGLPSVLLRFLPDGKAVPTFDRAWIALVLTAQAFLGVSLGVAAQGVLAVGVIGYVLPWFGFRILEFARQIAEFNLPERIWSLLIG
ncbi:hypothetical protein HL666_14860 [Bradyrhizobium sp. 83002]|uniref:hypothetical protein n=1 Tax=Bradyrhizobium aeschynomenes TaxID=2734909 RepID=UPI001552E5B6|nr:hypothetical protein [Bradyrhizobium aeschynomenes]NPU12050.1 hypothetical protein [Bradyrhizobium aeschynomenes]